MAALAIHLLARVRLLLRIALLWWVALLGWVILLGGVARQLLWVPLWGWRITLDWVASLRIDTCVLGLGVALGWVARARGWAVLTLHTWGRNGLLHGRLVRPLWGACWTLPLVTSVKLHLVLSLHASAHRAPDDLRNVVNDVRNLCQLLTARQAGCNVTQACQVLTEDHGANQAVVTRRVHDALLILDGPSGGCHTLSEAKEDLQAKAELRATLLSHSARTRAVSVAADISGHVIIDQLLSQQVRHTIWTTRCQKAVSGVCTTCCLELCVPCLSVSCLAYFKLLILLLLELRLIAEHFVQKRRGQTRNNRLK